MWVDETRPRNQGASLTAFELGAEKIAHTVIVDNAGGHLMQHGEVDLCIVGSDRTTRRGDVCNKIGTYLKALAAHASEVPFYVALPGSTLDWRLGDGVKEIPIEERSGDEVSFMSGLTDAGEVTRVRSHAAGLACEKFWLRRDAGALCDGARHGARRLRGERAGPSGAISGGEAGLKSRPPRDLGLTVDRGAVA